MFDVHTHFIPEPVMDWLKANRHAVRAEWIKKDDDKEPFLSVNGKWQFELKRAFIDEREYLTSQTEAGIVQSIVSPIPQLFLYEWDPGITAELSQVYNDALSVWIHAHPDRLHGLATVPMNRPEAAAAELERAMDRGLKGAIIATSWSGHMLTEDRFLPFWEAANARQAIVFVHPLLCEDRRLNSRMMPNLIGVPWETTVCATNLVLNGWLARFPDVKILLAHGGGFFPYQLGRMDQGFRRWEAVSAHLAEEPQSLAKQFWYDSVLWSSAALQLLIQTVGADRVAPGTDFPFDLCEWPPAEVGTSGFQSLVGWQ